MRFFDFSGTQRVSSIASSARLRSVRSGNRPSIGPAGGGSALGMPNAKVSISEVIGMNHCGVQRKMILAFDRQLCG
jgi:hypothetical protein